MLNALQQIALTVATFVTSLFAPITQALNVPSQTSTPTPPSIVQEISEKSETTVKTNTQEIKSGEVEEQKITISGSYSYLGKDVKFTASFPVGGGAVTGSIEGLCWGSITGNYAGGEGGRILGTGEVTCGIGLLKPKGTGRFDGDVYPKQGKAIIHIEGKVVGVFSFSESQTFYFPVK